MTSLVILNKRWTHSWFSILDQASYKIKAVKPRCLPLLFHDIPKKSIQQSKGLKRQKILLIYSYLTFNKSTLKCFQFWIHLIGRQVNL